MNKIARRGFLAGGSAIALAGAFAPPLVAVASIPKALADDRWEWVPIVPVAPGNAAWLKLYEEYNEQILAMARFEFFTGPLRSFFARDYEARYYQHELKMRETGWPFQGPTMPPREQLPAPLLDVESVRGRLTTRAGHWRHPDHEVFKQFMNGPPDDVFEKIADAADRDIGAVVARNHSG